MAALFDDREKSFENKYALDLELEFKSAARANKLMGNWVAEQIKMTESEAAEYALSLVETGLKQSGEWDVVMKVRQDLERNGIHLTEEELRQKYTELHATAAQQIRSDER